MKTGLKKRYKVLCLMVTVLLLGAVFLQSGLHNVFAESPGDLDGDGACDCVCGCADCKCETGETWDGEECSCFCDCDNCPCFLKAGVTPGENTDSDDDSSTQNITWIYPALAVISAATILVLVLVARMKDEEDEDEKDI